MDHRFSSIFCKNASDEVKSLSLELYLPDGASLPSNEQSPSQVRPSVSSTSYASALESASSASTVLDPQPRVVTTSISAFTVASTSNPQGSRFKRILKKIFGPSNRPRLTPEELGDRLNAQFYPGSLPIVRGTEQKNGKGRGTATASGVIVRSPNPTPLTTFGNQDPFTRGSAGHDSKFGSISSLSSLHKPPPTSITFTLDSLLRLQSLIRRTKRSYERQEYLTKNLSANLIHQLLRKKCQLQNPLASRRIKPEDKAAMNRDLFHAKESAGRIFLRKAVFLQRSLGVLAQLRDMVEKNWDRDTSGFMVVLEVSPETIHDFVITLNADLKLQQHLDEELLMLISKGAEDKRFRATVNDKIMTERFVQFLADRVKVLLTSYEQTAKLTAKVEDMAQGHGRGHRSGGP
jgi:hypothetical protein